MSTPIHLEGTTLEGGGQLLRLATCLSALTHTPIHITAIRGNRSGGGGLKAQHLTSVQWLGQASHARISGMGLKSPEITFMPSPTTTNGGVGEDVVIKQSTPGAVNLVFQAILPYVLFRGGDEKVRVRITGGTNVSNSPSYDYIEQVLLPMLTLIGIPPIDAALHSRGWSQGGAKIGSVTYTITPLNTKLPAFLLTHRGGVKSIRATVIAPKQYECQIAEELDVMFEKRESRFFGTRDADIGITFEDSQHEKRFYLLLVATTTAGVKLGRDWLYDQGVRAGKVDTVIASLVRQVSNDLLSEIEHGGCVDEHLRDQLVVFQTLAEGRSRVYGGERKGVRLEPSLHARTAHWVAEEVVGVEFDEDGGCEGIGLAVEAEEEEKGEGRADEELVEGLKKLDVSA
ncbi:EPT/RTPC-like protein [Lentithecium fluviatile CBS 122367]|uniref:EPT/RTPC-like protein n=1 Tax=Lentithecium fluviatile CBS 122367 TaxID=1168545 RepID=A0A6G1IC57_9PLEO|nr:EPT/RTPC-like protein [Lentithecium fluviatile CBS 122367]